MLSSEALVIVCVLTPSVIEEAVAFDPTRNTAVSATIRTVHIVALHIVSCDADDSNSSRSYCLEDGDGCIASNMMNRCDVAAWESFT